MTAPCPHTPPHPHDLRPCEPCGHCNAPSGVWCAPRCPLRLERVGEPVDDRGSERWPVEWFAGMPRAEQRSLVLFMCDKDDADPAVDFSLPEMPDMPAAPSVAFDFGAPAASMLPSRRACAEPKAHPMGFACMLCGRFL